MNINLKFRQSAIHHVICQIYMIGIALTKLITGIIGIITIGYWMPKIEIKLAMKYAQWNFKRKQNSI